MLPSVAVLSLTLMMLFVSGSPGVLSVPVRTCIINCGQCKRMYGEYFMGQRCAEECLKTNGLMFPDCNEPRTVMRYLRRLS